MFIRVRKTPLIYTSIFTSTESYSSQYSNTIKFRYPTYFLRCFINSFLPNAPFLYPLKTSENFRVFWYFQGIEKVCIGNKWINTPCPLGVQQPLCTVYRNNRSQVHENDISCALTSACYEIFLSNNVHSNFSQVLKTTKTSTVGRTHLCNLCRNY